MKLRLPTAALVLLVIASLGASQIPRWAFQFEAKACCCGHAGRCPCPDHQLPNHDQEPTARQCGSGGYYVSATPIPVFELPSPPRIVAMAIVQSLVHARPVAPHTAPDPEEPAAPS